MPASFVVIRHVRTKLSCTKCDCIVQAEAPSRPIARGLAGPGLLAHVLVSKYCDHLPLYRQSEIYADFATLLRTLTVPPRRDQSQAGVHAVGGVLPCGCDAVLRIQRRRSRHMIGGS